MLVLSRKKGETILIGDEIEITVVDIKGEQIRLGINAPKKVSILRKEIHIAVKEENKAALATRDPDLKSMAELMRKKTKYHEKPNN